MNIILSDITGSDLYVVPVVPPDVDIQDGGQNDTLKTIKGNIRLIGEKGLKKVSWSSIFPVYKNYSWVAIGSRQNGHDYVNFIQDKIDAEVPIRIIITSLSKRPIVNMLATIDEGFTASLDTAGDLKYSLSLTEFPEKAWDYLNASPTLRQYLQTIAVQSVAKKALAKVGLI
jgi:hypothetical protein